MQIKQPEPFFFEGGERAVLLLHGFTGHSADVRMLGRYLNSKGYTCYAPIYRGHGKSPEELIGVRMFKKLINFFRIKVIKKLQQQAYRLEVSLP